MTETGAASEAGALAVFDGDVDLVVRPLYAPRWVVPGAVLWQQRRRRRVFLVEVTANSAWVVHTAVWFVCGMWQLPELAQTAAAYAGELVADAVTHAAWPGNPADRIEVAVSVAGRSLVVEVCDPDPHWPMPAAAANKAGDLSPMPASVRVPVLAQGGEVGCLSGQTGKNVFFILLLPQDTTNTAAQQSGGAR